MNRTISFFLASILCTTFGFAGSEAEEAYGNARSAFLAGDYEKACSLAERASRTAPDNPEVFLLLGKARYQLGDLTDAIKAWRRTLSLAPEESYAASMIKALRREQEDVDVRIKLLNAMVHEHLFAQTIRECSVLLTEKALSGKQRASIIQLKAEALLKTGNHVESRKLLQELLTFHASDIAKLEVQLLQACARLKADGFVKSEGLRTLEWIAEQNPDTSAGATARYELIMFALKLNTNEGNIAKLAQWLESNPDHSMAETAVKMLIQSWLALTENSRKPVMSASISGFDNKALALLKELYRQSPELDPDNALAGSCLSHLRNFYLGNHAAKAAAEGAGKLLSIPLNRGTRLQVLQFLADAKVAAAHAYLDREVRAGRLPPVADHDKMPAPLAEALAAYASIDKEYPNVQPWKSLDAFAHQVHAFSSKITNLPFPHTLPSPSAWAFEIARRVLEASRSGRETMSAFNLTKAIIGQCGKKDEATAKEKAVALSALVIETLHSKPTLLDLAMKQHAELLDEYARFCFQKNREKGLIKENAALSPPQKQFIQSLVKHVQFKAAHAPTALAHLKHHLLPWIKAGHWNVAEDAYTLLGESLSAMEKHQVTLAIASLWIEEVFEKHKKLLEAGFSIPEALDPRLAKALLSSQALLGVIARDNPLVKDVHSLWLSVTNHYKSLRYYAIAEQTLQVGDGKGSGTDTFRLFHRAQLSREKAVRDLEHFLSCYHAEKKVAISQPFKDAVKHYKSIISAAEQNEYRLPAIRAVMEMGSLLEKHHAYDGAVALYRDLAKFLGTVPRFSGDAGGIGDSAEQAAFQAASSLYAKASRDLSRNTAAHEDKNKLKVSVSDPFKAAIAEFKGFIKEYPESRLIRKAMSSIMQVAYAYVTIGAWNAAEAVFSGLMEWEHPLHHPEVLLFCRGLCRSGRTMPDHAGKILKVLVSGNALFTGLISHANVSYSEDEERILAAAEVNAPSPTAPMTALTGPGRASVNLNEQKEEEQSDRDSRLVAMIQQQESTRASRVAQMPSRNITSSNTRQSVQGRQAQQAASFSHAILSDAELVRQDEAIKKAYTIFLKIINEYPRSTAGMFAQKEILLMINYWRGIAQWKRAAALAQRFLKDNPGYKKLPELRLAAAQNLVAHASRPIAHGETDKKKLAGVSSLFEDARRELKRIITDFPNAKEMCRHAQWDFANSFLSQARVIGGFNKTLGRGYYVRAAKELLHAAESYPNYPRSRSITQMLWNIAQELESRGFYTDAITVLSELSIYDPLDQTAQKGALRVAELYHQKLKRPLRAAESYQELNFMRGGNDRQLQDAIFGIGAELKLQKRWVEALHILETFVNSFPHHPSSGEALAMVGAIHQTNESWEDAIAAYNRVIMEYKNGKWIQDAEWSIATCRINLSQWSQAMEAYKKYLESYPKDSRTKTIQQRIDVLKQLTRYQELVDEKDQRKAFDAQYQIAAIVGRHFSNPIKSIIEYRKVITNWPKSHLADDALYKIGITYMDLNETVKARTALQQVAQKYPGSPFADDALFMVGKSYADEAARLGAVTREKSLQIAQELAQRNAYKNVQKYRRTQVSNRSSRISSLKKAGKELQAQLEEAGQAANWGVFNDANVRLFSQQAFQEVETFTAAKLADRRDKINAALRKAVEAYTEASLVAGADKAGDALLEMATIYDEKLKDADSAMKTWLEIVRQFSGTTVAEDASWRIAHYYEERGDYTKAIDAYTAFLRNYRRSPKAESAQFSIAENYEQLGQWISAMDAYTSYMKNFPKGKFTEKAKEQINWIKTYRL